MVETEPQKEGNQLHTILAPKGRKSDDEDGEFSTSHELRVRRRVMPKLKSHRGATKRFKKTATGKFLRGKAFKRHILTSKPTRRKRQVRGTRRDFTRRRAASCSRMLPYD